MRACASLASIALVFSVASCGAVPAPVAPLPFTPLGSPLVRAPTPLGAGTARVAAPAPASADKPPMAASESASPVALPPVSLGDIGAAGSVRLLSTSASGAWVALCDGEPKTAKLVLGSGTGEPIDDVLAQDSSGRYVVVAEGGAALLLDAVTSTRVSLTELGADVRRVRADYAEHRTLSFDANGRALAYLRKQGTASQIVVRQLDSGAEQAYPAGAGEVFRLRLSADARYVTFDALREDTSKNGKLDWPAPEEPTASKVCDRPALPKFRSFGYQGRGDALIRAVVTLADGGVRDVPDLVTPLGAGLLVRETDGSLRLEQAGKRTPLAPASCSGRVLFADAERGLVLAACSPPPPPKKTRGAPPPPSGKRDVWLFGPGLAKDLHSELYETSTDREAVVGTRLVPLYPGSDANVLDLERRELLPLPAGSRVVTTRGALALIWRDSELLRYDAQAKTEQRLAHGVLKSPDLLQSGAAVLLSPFVIVGLEGPALSSPARPLALSAGGFVLVPSSAQAGASSGISGPLHWVDARLPAPDGPPR